MSVIEFQHAKQNNPYLVVFLAQQRASRVNIAVARRAVSIRVNDIVLLGRVSRGSSVSIVSDY
jgi:hypothetical protein